MSKSIARFALAALLGGAGATAWMCGSALDDGAGSGVAAIGKLAVVTAAGVLAVALANRKRARTPEDPSPPDPPAGEQLSL